MGWSCGAEASRTLETWTNACYANSGSSNVWEDSGKKYFFEISSREHRDGAITGTIYRNSIANSELCRKSGSFRIEGDGTVQRAPMFLKRAATLAGRKVA